MANKRTLEIYAFKQNLGFADMEVLPKGRLVRATQNADVAHIDNTESSILLVSGVTIPTGRMLAFFGKVTATVDVNDAANSAELIAYQDGVVIGVGYRRLPGTAGDPETVEVYAEADGSGGTSTFELKAKRFTGTQTWTAVGNATNPGIMRVDDLGPSF